MISSAKEANNDVALIAVLKKENWVVSPGLL
jgi:K+/H+ antiporter YhaU regulatory subunit KhtT